MISSRLVIADAAAVTISPPFGSRANSEMARSIWSGPRKSIELTSMRPMAPQLEYSELTDPDSSAGNNSTEFRPAKRNVLEVTAPSPNAHPPARTANPKGPPSSPVQLRMAVWTGDARDTRPGKDLN